MYQRKKGSNSFLKIFCSFKINLILFLFFFPSYLYSIDRKKIFFLNTDLPKSYKIDKNKFQNELQKILKSKITILNEEHILYRTNKKIKKLKENIKKDLKQGRCNLLCRNKIVDNTFYRIIIIINYSLYEKIISNFYNWIFFNGWI